MLVTGSDDRARYVMIGGFLGAGKTTAVDRLARMLADRGLVVGLITNDQSTGLVDTALLRSHGFEVEEIAGRCFCCRFDSLQEAAGRLSAATRPDVFLAEPVGSCTDLVATVSYPLRRIYGDRFVVAPLSVVVDPKRAARILGLVQGRSFSDKVVYVYRKQLEEADLIVVNKCDAIEPKLQESLVAALCIEFPRAEVVCASAKEGDGLEPWLQRLLSTEGAFAPTMTVDYDTYAEGEARLGWLNATWRLSPEAPFDANAFLLRVTEALRARLAADGAEIGHLKMTLDPGGAAGLIAVISVVDSESEPDLHESLVDMADSATLIVNLRAEADPHRLSALVEEVFGAENVAGIAMRREHEETLRPARPVPTHRVTVEDNG